MDEMEALQAELDHYKAEKQKIRDIVGQVGGKNVRWSRRAINVAFLVLVVAAFAFDVLRFAMGWKVPFLPPLLLLELAVLLVSVKIIWMIHTQTKVDHFQFWILNSIEFQISMLSRRVNDLVDAMKAPRNAPAAEPPADPGAKAKGGAGRNAEGSGDPGGP